MEGFIIPFSEVTRNQVAEMFMVSPSTVDRWSKDGYSAKGERFVLQKNQTGKFKTEHVINFHKTINLFKNEIGNRKGKVSAAGPSWAGA